ncbi:MAG: hypothetical protein AAF394_09800, partial [Planctomycetota bacterium]
GPNSWFFAAPYRAARLEEETEDAFEGKKASVLQTDGAPGRGMAANLMQSIDGKPWRGKRVRFSAAVKTKDLAEGAAAQLWFRVDREAKQNGRPLPGAFDNMGDRPIRAEQWERYEIVLKVDEDAERLALGLFVLGAGTAWVDDFKLEEVDLEKGGNETSNSSNREQAGTDSGSEESGEKRDGEQEGSETEQSLTRQARVRQAMQEAESAPQQSLFSPWLLLALVALILFALAALPTTWGIRQHKEESDESEATLEAGHLRRFCFRFACVYWLLYCLPAPFSNILGQLGFIATPFRQLVAWYTSASTFVVNSVAKYVFSLEDLVPPNGSGDTTFNYLQVFTYFWLALLVSTIWFFVDRRKSDSPILRDVLNSFLRYVLAATMLGYGLAKLGFDVNQFPPLGEYHLTRTWGDTSPMGVLWSFMSASRSYTFFAGFAEVLGGILLLSRRTSLFGALVVFAVMTNVMLMNFCYDVPVKLYSSHLVCMALFLVLPNLDRLANLFLLNRPSSPAELKPPYAKGVGQWVHLVLKLGLVLVIAILPIWQHSRRQMVYFAERATQPEYYGSFDVEMEGDSQIKWDSVKIESLPYDATGAAVKTTWMSVRTSMGVRATSITENENQFVVKDYQMLGLAGPEVEFSIFYDGTMLLKSSDLEFQLSKQQGNEYRLTNRGFRWVNEVPFNR